MYQLIKHTIPLPKTIFNDLKHRVELPKWFSASMARKLLFQVYKGWFNNKSQNLTINNTWMSLSSAVLNSMTPNYKKYIELFKRADILIVDEEYIVGAKCRRYRFPIHYYKQEVVRRTIRIRKKEEKAESIYVGLKSDWTPALPPLEEQMLSHLNNTISIDYENTMDYLNNKARKKDGSKYTQKELDNLIYNVDRINNKDFFLVKDSFSGRIHTNATNINSYIRKNFLKMNGNPMVEVDIKSSQPTFLINWLQDKPVDSQELHNYTKLLRKGIFYETFAKWFSQDWNKPMTRDEAKVMVYKCFYDEARPKPKKGIGNWHYQQTFSRRFPTIYQEIQKTMVKGCHNRLAQALQSIEVEYIKSQVEQLNIPYITIHDSVMVEEHNIHQIKHINNIENIIKKKEEKREDRIIYVGLNQPPEECPIEYMKTIIRKSFQQPKISIWDANIEEISTEGIWSS